MLSSSLRVEIEFGDDWKTSRLVVAVGSLAVVISNGGDDGDEMPRAVEEDDDVNFFKWSE